VKLTLSEGPLSGEMSFLACRGNTKRIEIDLDKFGDSSLWAAMTDSEEELGDRVVAPELIDGLVNRSVVLLK
jgi:hypothetical protein